MKDEEYLELVQDIGGPGVYSSASLYRWYVSMAEENGWETVTRRKFGLALRALGLKSRVRRLYGVPTRSWLVTRGSLKRAGADMSVSTGRPG